MRKLLVICAAAMTALPLVAVADTLLLTGGATSFDGDDAILTFTNSGPLTVTGSGTVDVLLVGGGGGSGATFNNSTDLFGAGGGGAGGYGGGSGVVIMRYRYESNSGFIFSVQ